MDALENLAYWNDPHTESMYDKNILRLEIEAIKREICVGSTILDFGCGDGESTEEYSKIGHVIGVDFSEVRLEMARKRLPDVVFMQGDVRNAHTFGQYDVVIAQRLLINLASWEEQSIAIDHLMNMVKPDGKLLLSEGSLNGVNRLNRMRAVYDLNPIPIPEHNVFIDDAFLETVCDLKKVKSGLGAYYFLTRGIQPALTDDIKWDSRFNLASSIDEIQKLLDLGEFSRIKIWKGTK